MTDTEAPQKQRSRVQRPVDGFSWTRVWPMDMQTTIAAMALALSALALVRGEILQRRRVSEEAQQRAVEHVREALEGVLAVLEHADARLPAKGEISRVILDFERTCRRWEQLLPTGVKHLRMSVRHAMANCFGPPASIAADPRIEDLEMRTFDTHWWDIGYTYVEQAQAHLGRWLVGNRRKPLVVVRYDQWRSDEDYPSTNLA